MPTLAEISRRCNVAHIEATRNFKLAVCEELGKRGFNLDNTIPTLATIYTTYDVYLEGEYKGHEVVLRFTHQGEMVKAVITYKLFVGNTLIDANHYMRIGSTNFDTLFKKMDKFIASLTPKL